MVNLMGYTRTSEQFKIALGFALRYQEVNKVSVVFDIDFKGETGLFQLTDEFTAYPGENEILVQDGFKYLVLNVAEKINKKDKRNYD